jgi:NAD(P)-dependent dehydrogenase (short-subunit alcohol dehydrogenase family)
MGLDDRVAIVTGAGHGIGRAIAVALAQAGAHVVAVDIEPAAARATADAVSAAGRKGVALDIDVGDLASIEVMVRRATDSFGHIDVLVNNAGVSRRAYIMDLTEDDWERIMRVNAKGVFFCLQRVAREMIPRRSGVIVNIASIAGKGYAGTSNAIYAASKGAVISLTRIAALQLARHNINVNAICPGSTTTAFSEANLRDRAREQGVSVEEMRRQRNANIPLGRPNDPEDIAASPCSSPRPAPGTSPGNPSTWTAESSSTERRQGFGGVGSRSPPERGRGTRDRERRYRPFRFSRDGSGATSQRGPVWHPGPGLVPVAICKPARVGLTCHAPAVESAASGPARRPGSTQYRMPVEAT